MSLEKSSISWSAKQLKNMIANGKIDFDHIIQRSYVWERKRKSALIESMILGYPIYTVSKDRLGDYVRTCSDKEMAEIDKGMLHSLGIATTYIERERLRKPIHRILPHSLSREIFTRICMNSFLINLQRGDGKCKSFLRHEMVV